MSETDNAGDERTVWFVRPVILLAAVYLINGIVHESVHALTAYALDVPFTLHHFAVDLARNQGTLTERAAIGVAGPLSSLVIGVICWLCYKRAKGLRSELMLLYLAVFGIGTFFGNLMSTAFVGDFSRAAIALRLPMAARYTARLIGFLSICGLHFWAGSELRRLAPIGSSRLRVLILMVVLPVVAGAAIVTLASLPIPSAFVFGRLAEAAFWVFAAAGVLLSRNAPSGGWRTLHLGWADLAALTAATVVVRVLAGGVVFQE